MLMRLFNFFCIDEDHIPKKEEKGLECIVIDGEKRVNLPNSLIENLPKFYYASRNQENKFFLTVIYDVGRTRGSNLVITRSATEQFVKKENFWFNLDYTFFANREPTFERVYKSDCLEYKALDLLAEN